MFTLIGTPMRQDPKGSGPHSGVPLRLITFKSTVTILGVESTELRGYCLFRANWFTVGDLDEMETCLAV